MHRTIRLILRRNLRLVQFGVPIWAIALVVVLIAAAAGQTVGPVFVGSTNGTAALTVEQAITLDTDIDLGDNPSVSFVSGTGDSASTRNDEGTSFAAAIELRNGQRVQLTLFVQNHSGADAAAMLTLNIPDALEVALAEIGDADMAEARLSPNTWLLVLPTLTGVGDDDGFVIDMRPTDDLKPGYYTVSGRLSQFSGGGEETEDIPVSPAADLAIAVADNPDPVLRGSSLTYTIEVTNNGPETVTPRLSSMIHWLNSGQAP